MSRPLSDLRGRKVGVRKSSSYYQALAPLQAQHGFDLELVSEDEETEDILEAVAEGQRQLQALRQSDAMERA